MGLKYSLVRRPDLRKDVPEGSTLLFANITARDKVSFVELCDELSQLSSASPGDVRGVLEGMAYVVKKNLMKGNLIQLGSLGSFRLSVGSRGVEMEKGFRPSLFKKPRIVYTPGATLRSVAKHLRFSKLEVVETDNVSCERPHAI